MRSFPGFLSLAASFLAASTAFGQTHGVPAQNKYDLKLILQLRLEDDLGVDPKRIVEHCSKILANREHEKKEDVGRLLDQRSTAYARLRNMSAAKKDFDDLCILEPNNSNARLGRAAIYSVTENGMDDAIKEAREAIRLDPKNPRAHTALGMYLLDKGNGNGCIDSINKAIELSPKHAPAHFMRGYYYYEMRLPDLCLESMNKYLELSPYNPGLDLSLPYYYRGFSLSVLNRPMEALSSLLMARKLNPTSLDVVGELAIVYEDLGKFYVAAHYAEEFIRLDPSDPFGYDHAVRSYSKIGKTKEAAVLLEKELAEVKKERISPWELAETHVAIGRYAAAIEHFDKALTAKPGRFLTLVGKASLLATCPDPKYRDGKEAIRLATKAMEGKRTQECQKWRAAIALAEANAQIENFPQAVRFAKQAIELAGPDSGRLGELREKLKLFEKKTPYRMKINTAD